MTPTTSIAACPMCDGKGGWYGTTNVYSRGGNFSHEVEQEADCDYCNGTGEAPAAGLSPALGTTAAIEAHDLSPAIARTFDPTGEATPLRYWVFAGHKHYNQSGGSYVVETVACLLDEAIAAGDWESMNAEIFDNGFSAWGGEVDGFFTLDVSTYHHKPAPRYRVKVLPAWVTERQAAELWQRLAGGDKADWLLAMPAIVNVLDSESMFNIIRFLETKPRADKRKQLKRDLLAWLDGDRPYPSEAGWMTRPYDAHRRG